MSKQPPSGATVAHQPIAAMPTTGQPQGHVAVVGQPAPGTNLPPNATGAASHPHGGAAAAGGQQPSTGPLSAQAIAMRTAAAHALRARQQQGDIWKKLEDMMSTVMHFFFYLLDVDWTSDSSLCSMW